MEVCFEGVKVSEQTRQTCLTRFLSPPAAPRRRLCSDCGDHARLGRSVPRAAVGADLLGFAEPHLQGRGSAEPLESLEAAAIRRLSERTWTRR